ncbi:hypothetical protein FRB96_006024 [Tulasnella sp. 330]|nr:hypothetical protein FRB96_006024 [Tulasnella sp. 330]KAG8882052.1 hypothetical protein FRB98_003941 [Tulasnella sp. 332]
MKGLSLFLLTVNFVGTAFALYEQCGGIGWTGSTACTNGGVCVYSNPYYSQCLPVTVTTTSTSTSSKPSTMSTSTVSTPTTSTGSSTTTSVVSSTTTPISSATSSTPTSVPSAATTVFAGSETSTAATAWATAWTKAQAALPKLALQDKVNLATGIGWQKGPCVGNTAAISSIGFNGFCLQDSPVGVRFATSASVFPSGINTAATWNRALMLQRGAALGAEHKAAGVNVALGPDVNIMRDPTAGRNWEGYGGDPYLSGEAAFQTVTGMQSSGVQACAKHYINNEQEHDRDTETSNVDDRMWVTRGNFMLPFIADILVATWLDITTDWWVDQPKYGTEAANQGLDMVMPGEETDGGSVSYFGPALVAAVNSGAVPESRIDDMATRILAAWYLLGQDSGYPSINLNANVQGTHKTLIRQIGGASIVLLKNTNSALPLKNPASIGIIGSDAVPNPAGPNACTDRGCNTGILAVGWGSGTANFPYLSDPLSAITAQTTASISSSTSDTDTNGAQTAARGKSVAIVFITADSGEEYITVEGNVGDRNDLNAWHSGNALVAAVAAVNSNTIVVVNSVGPIVMEPWITNANITAVVWAGLLGQEAGNAIADVLFGAVVPSGKLPYTIAKQQTDYPAQVAVNGGTITYSEGLFVDYKWFDAQNITPRYEFGFGLSYTTFSYSGLIVGSPSSTGGTAPTGTGSSLSSWLHNDWVTVTFTVTNTGAVAGTEISQLYLVAPASANSPPNQLRGFTNVQLSPGQSGKVVLTLSRYSFAVWSTTAQQWQVLSGTYGIWVGASSRDKRLTGSITL